MDVDFNALPDNIATIFRGWVPAALLNVKHDARKELCQKDVFLTRQKIKTANKINFVTEPDVDFSGLSNCTTAGQIGWVPAALLNDKHDARPTQCIPYLWIFAILSKMKVFRLVLHRIEV